MNCPSCNRPNAEGLLYCDYCGTPLSAPSPGKRKTEVEAVPAPGPVRKRVTEFEAPAEPAPAPSAGGRRVHDPFDPFGVPSASAPAARAAAPSALPEPPSGPAPAPAARKKVTEYVAAGADAFAPPSPAPAPAAATGGAAPAAASGRRIIGWVITFDGHSDGLSFTLREGRNVLGRDPESDIVVGWDGTVSGTHAFLIWRLGRARIADANTQNGTFLNEEDVLGQIEVHDGDVLRIGRTRFLIRLLDQDKLGALWDLKTKPAGRD